ncbi:MAG: VanZ family protein [Clostridiales bacterium]|nr:VanZ family protein [Clostridiales bacterium]
MKINRVLLGFNLFFTVLILACILYFSLSGIDNSVNDSRKLTDIIVKIIYKSDYTQEEYEKLHQVVRKSAHVVLYGLFGAVLGLWVKLGSVRFSRKKLFICCVAICVAFGFADEWVKQYVPGRHFHAGEAVLNVVSAATGLCIIKGSGKKR